MKKRIAKILALCVVLVSAILVGTPAFAETYSTENSIFETQAFKSYQENGLPTTVLKVGEEVRYDYEDGSAVVIGVLQHTLQPVENSKSGDVSPCDMLFDAETIVYSNFINDDAGVREYSVYTTAKYRYGTYVIIMQSVNTSIDNVPEYTQITSNNNSVDYEVLSQDCVEITTHVDVRYVDTLHDTSHRDIIDIPFTITCGLQTITISSNVNVEQRI